MLLDHGCTISRGEFGLRITAPARLMPPVGDGDAWSGLAELNLRRDLAGAARVVMAAQAVVLRALEDERPRERLDALLPDQLVAIDGSCG